MFKRQPQDKKRIEDFMNSERVLNLSMIVNGEPNVVPMIYVYDEEQNCIFLHSAPSGTKIEALRKNNQVAFSIMKHSANDVIDTDGKPCGYGIVYESVVGYGKAEILTGREEKVEAYNMMSKKFRPQGHDLVLEYRENELTSSVILRIDIETMSGKAWDGIGSVYYF